MSNPVVHFELPAGDKQRAASFYSQAFGWQTKVLGEEMGGYILATTCDTDEKSGFPKSPGMINGGIYQKDESKPEQTYPSVVISVDDLAASMQKVTTAGGKLVGEPQDIPGIGKFITIQDTEGNYVGMLQSLPMPASA